MTRPRNSVARNALFGLSTWILPLVLSFIATPVIVTALGNEDYGIFALVLGFVGYSFNFGIGRAITKFLAEYRAEKESEKASEIISATLALNIIVGLLGGLLIISLAGWLVDSVFLIGPEQREKTLYAFFIAAGIIFVTMIGQVGNSVLQGVHRFDVYSKLFNLNSFAVLGGNIVLAVSGFGLLWLLGWNLVALLVTASVGLAAAHRIVPEFKFRLDFSRPAISRIFGFSAWVIGYQILANVLLLFERGWIMRKLGPESLTLYVVPMTIGIYIHSLIASLMLVIFPLASESLRDRERIEALYKKATKLTCIMVFFIGVTIIALRREFLELWIGADFASAASHLLVYHTVTFSLAAILIVAWQMADGLGYPWYNFTVFSVCLAVGLAGMILLIDPYGNEGVAMARLAGFGTVFLSIFLCERLFFGGVQFRFWLRLLAVLVPAAAVAALAERFVIGVLENSWPLLVASAAAGGLVYLAILALFKLISKEELELLRRAFKV